jgi:transposase InsO family protein
MTNWNEKLSPLYYSPDQPGAYGGVDRLYARAKRLYPSLTRSNVVEWLREQDSYTLHKPTKQKFVRRSTIVAGVGEQLQADLMDIRSHASYNDNFNFLLTAVDCFSRKGWAIPVRSKSGENVSEALEKIFKDNQFYRLQTDKGKEFYNVKVAATLSKFNIDHFSSENETIKSSLVERFNRTLRDRIHRYLTAKSTGRFLNVLQDFVKAYNDSEHRSIGMSPNEVNKSNQSKLFDKMYETKAWKKIDTPLVEGDLVRISKTRSSFERGYTPNWTREIFQIDKVLINERPIVYIIKDYSGEKIRGTFYRHELQVVKEPKTYQIESILETRRRKGGKKQFFVKWLGYPDSFNSWINEEDMV